MGLLFPVGWIYVLRPVAACLIPAKVLELVKRYEGRRAKRMESTDSPKGSGLKEMQFQTAELISAK